ncbi:unnamed protein product [Polarella glacialis]|uniref:Uncharacterized protein n=1 Tax=Polarella glacialis TaxID=89957 RepID=A0A813HFE7_POLGL|nr:unnamed protein product [Polarella glacialis]
MGNFLAAQGADRSPSSVSGGTAVSDVTGGRPSTGSRRTSLSGTQRRVSTHTRRVSGAGSKRLSGSGSAQRPILRQGKARSTAGARSFRFWGWCSGRADRGRRVTFRSTVKVSEFSRRLGGGDGVPTDGSVVALGLGKVVATSSVATASGPRAQSDQISWMSAELREQALEASMGRERFTKARAQQVPEMSQLLERRKLSREDGKDMVLMPSSFAEARARALEVSAEVEAGKAAEKKVIPYFPMLFAAATVAEVYSQLSLHTVSA